MLIQAVIDDLLDCKKQADVVECVKFYGEDLRKLGGWRFPDAERQAWYDAACLAEAEIEYRQELHNDFVERGGYSRDDR